MAAGGTADGGHILTASTISVGREQSAGKPGTAALCSAGNCADLRHVEMQSAQPFALRKEIARRSFERDAALGP